MGEELVPEPLPFRGTLDQARDIHELDGSRHDLSRLHDVGNRLQSKIGDLRNSEIGLDGGERVVLRRDSGIGQRVEER